MTKRKKEKVFELDLVNNGIDFIRTGIESYFKNDEVDPTDFKYALINMFAGTLLILKARLEKAHPSLIYEELDPKTRKGEAAKTVDYSELLRRLAVCAGVRLTENDSTMLTTVRRIRNELEHYSVSIDLEKTQVLIGDLAEFLLRFMRDELNTDLETRLGKVAWYRLRETQQVALEYHRRKHAAWYASTEMYKKMAPDDMRAFYETRKAAGANTDWCESFCTPKPHTQTVLQIDDTLAVCMNPDCRALYGPETCRMCGEPLSLKMQDRGKGECLRCWAELHMDPSEMYDDGGDEEPDEEEDAQGDN